MLPLVFAKGIMLVQKYPKIFQQRKQLWVCLFVFPLSVLAGHDSNGAAWILTRVSLKIKICLFMQCGAGLCSLLPGDIKEKRLANFSEKEEKTVVGRGRAFTVMWAGSQTSSRGWIPNGHAPFSPIAWGDDARIMPAKQLVRFCLWMSFQHKYFHPLLNIWAIPGARGKNFPAGQEMTARGSRLPPVSSALGTAPFGEGRLCPSVRCYIFSPGVVSGAAFPSLRFQLLPILFPWGPWKSLCPCGSVSSRFIGSQSNHHPCLLRLLQQAGQVSCCVTESGWAPPFAGCDCHPPLSVLSLYCLMLNKLCKGETGLRVKVVNRACSYTVCLNGIYCGWHGVCFGVTLFQRKAIRSAGLSYTAISHSSHFR